MTHTVVFILTNPARSWMGARYLDVEADSPEAAVNSPEVDEEIEWLTDHEQHVVEEVAIAGLRAARAPRDAHGFDLEHEVIEVLPRPGEVFRVGPGRTWDDFGGDRGRPMEPGWYRLAVEGEGCPEGEPLGPFDTREAALRKEGK